MDNNNGKININKMIDLLAKNSSLPIARVQPFFHIIDNNQLSNISYS